MIQWLLDLITNRYFLTSLSAWCLAQVAKMFIHWILTKKFDWRRMFGDGGMPSAHSAMVSSLAVICGLGQGAGSVAFAATLIFAFVVCHDAMGVRLETGKQAVIINDLLKAVNDLYKADVHPEAKLKEFVGHTPVQVIAGILLGVVDALVMYWILF